MCVVKSHVCCGVNEHVILKLFSALKDAVPLTMSEVNLLLEHRSQLNGGRSAEDEKALGPVLPNARDFCARFGKLKNEAANERVRK